MEMQQVEISKIKINPDNPRTVKDYKFKQLIKSIKEFPEMLNLRPIVVNDEMVILGGNQRFQAAVAAGFKTVPVIKASNLTPDQQKEFIIKDNVSTGDWDFTSLDAFNQPLLIDWGLDAKLFRFNKQVHDDDFEVPKDGLETDIVLGDLFEIGNHRLLCGDSTNADHVARLMDGKLLKLYITDPPYGVSYTGKTKEALQIDNDSLSEEDTHNLFQNAFQNAFPGASIYASVPAGLLQLGFMKVMHDAKALRQCLVWDKGQMVMGHSDYHYQHEPILYGWLPNGSRYFTNDRTKTTVFKYPKPMRNAEHPTMKPVDLWSEMISNSTMLGDICYDSFTGSGTTIVACEKLKRKGYGIEMSPRYCQVIINRMRNLVPDIIIKKNGVVI